MYTVRNRHREYSLLWVLFALLGGIVIWEVAFTVSYFGAEGLCGAGAGWALHLVAGIAVVVAVASMATALGFMRVTSDVPESESSPRDHRTNFLGAQGLALGVLGLFGILGVELANIFVFCR